jgi:hypothetical protein
VSRSDSTSKSLLVHAAALSSTDASNYGRIKGESCRDMILTRGSSMGSTRRLSSEKDSKNDPSGFSMTLERGDRDRDRDFREHSLSDLSVLSPKGSCRGPDRCEPLSQGVSALVTAEMIRTPHGKTGSESQATRLSPTPLTRASIPLTCQSINAKATASDVPHTDTEGHKDAATSLTDSYGAPVVAIDQNHRRADALVCTGQIRTGAQTAPSQQSRVIDGSGEEIVTLQVRNSGGIRGPGSLVISGRVLSVSGAGTNSARHRAATHKLSYTHNYRCMYQSQRMQSGVFKKPESEGLGFIVKVLNYNTSLPQGPEELVKK